MGRRGPKPTPTHLLKMAGSNRVTKQREESEVKGPAGVPRKPSWLNRDAKAAWDHVIQHLSDMGVLTLIDAKSLERYCCTWARWKSAVKYLARHGDTIEIRDDEGRVKYIQVRPEVAIANQMAQQLERLEHDFGMNPSARTRIQVEPAKDGDEHGKDRFFKSKKKRA